MSDELVAKMDIFMQRMEAFVLESAADRAELRARVEGGQTAFARQSVADQLDIRHELEHKHSANAHKLDEIVHQVDCLAREMRKFKEQWTDTLQVIKADREEWKLLRKAIIEKSVVGAIWALLVFLAYASWAYITHKS